MFNENQESGEPSPIFTLIKKGDYSEVERLFNDGEININSCDSVGNDVVTRLLKAKQYDLVLQMMKKRNWDVNHQNVEGNTFGHILALDNSVAALKIVEQLTKKSNYVPNIKNNNGQTVLDRAINNHYTYTMFKILEDKRFNNIDVLSFKKLWNACIKNTYYGKYSKVNNLEIILESLEKKELMPGMKHVVDHLNNNIDNIKSGILNDNNAVIDKVLSSISYND